MNTRNRILLFILVCIPLRSVLAWWASRDETKNDEVQWWALGVITALIGLGFMIVGTGRKLGWIQNVGGGGGKVYWNSFLHGFMYLLFTGLWFGKVNNSYGVLVADLVIGFLFFLNNYKHNFVIFLSSKF